MTPSPRPPGRAGADQGPKIDQPRRLLSASSARRPSRELPEPSRPGDQTQAEATPGTTTIMPPPTPLLPGTPTREGELARAVVMAAGQHQGVDAAGALGGNDGAAGLWVVAAEGEEARSHRELPAGHGDGAMVEIDAERSRGRGLRCPRRPSCSSRGQCSGTRCAARKPRRRCRWRSRDRPRRGGGNAGSRPASRARLVAGEDHVADHDRAGIDEGAFLGMPFSFSSWTMELKGLPEGPGRPASRVVRRPCRARGSG